MLEEKPFFSIILNNEEVFDKKKEYEKKSFMTMKIS
jgi:hypothetical protein